MAKPLKPGAGTPTPLSVPAGIRRPPLSPARNTRAIRDVVSNFDAQVAEAQGTPGFTEAWQYGGYEVADKMVLNQESIDNFGSKRYLQYMDPATPSTYTFQGEGSGLQYGEYDGVQTPAQGEYDIPTSTTNFKRPRTLAAGYDPNNQVVTVVFRDGTFYNYYGIQSGTWNIFKNEYSKGPLLNGGKTGGKGKQDGLLLRECTDRGEADLSQLGEEARDFFVTVARSAQIALRSSTARNRQGRFAKKTGPDKGLIGSRKASITSSANVASAKNGKNPSNGGKNRPTANKAN